MIENGETSDPGKYEIFEDGRGSRRSRYNQDAGRFERGLTSGGP